MAPPATTVASGVLRRRMVVSGTVQGVGFRPFVHRLATGLGLAGTVVNDSGVVVIEAEGAPADLEALARRLREEAPPLARVERIDWLDTAPQGDSGFRIAESRGTAATAHPHLSPDVTTCPACLAEMFDPGDRRYRYPFINCTDCGPRFTITTRVPYDRPNTTMAGFAMCPDCAAEYGDPAGRRFHAQPISCHRCGPRLWFDSAAGRVDGTEAALHAARTALAGGRIVAVKGIGGYHLACDAASDAAVGLLRRRKHRPAKPFAVMVPDLDTARSLARVDRSDAELLMSSARPVVLLEARPGGALSGAVAPDQPRVGIMVAYSPLHHLLFSPDPATGGTPLGPLVMTSGNLADEPICFDDGDARRRLAAVADGWLTHDRPIHVPCDDSVVLAGSGSRVTVRRSRGYTPVPVSLPFPVAPTVAVGGELKNTFCLASGADAWLSQHLGDMGSVETLSAFRRSLQQFRYLYGIEVEAVVADAHPGYQTRRWAEASGYPLLTVQHHRAHIASVMAEHALGWAEQVVGFAFDGTGFGDDGAVWGGEVLAGGYRHMERVGHLRYVPLPGGDTTVRRPYRMALAHLRAAGIAWQPGLAPVRAAGPQELAVLARQLERGTACTPTSSMGRLFDAVSSLLGLCQQATFEAQAAVALEAVAAHARRPEGAYRFAVRSGEIDPAPVLVAVLADMAGGTPVPVIAHRFHRSVAALVAGYGRQLCRQRGIATVALSGGVFQNPLLVDMIRAELSGSGIGLITHDLVPPNDGGIALGQIAAGASPLLPPGGGR